MKKLGMLTVLEEFPKEIGKAKKKVIYYRCRCECGKLYSIAKGDFNRKKLKSMHCGCQKPKHILTRDRLYSDYIEEKLTAKEISKKNNVSERIVREYIKIYKLTNIKKNGSGEKQYKKNRTGYGDLSGSYICRCKHHAKAKNREWNLEAKYLWQLYLNQNKKCKYSGLDIGFPDRHNSAFLNMQTASLDRIDSSKGYIKGNVQWVHKVVNKMKQEFKEEDFLKMIEAIYTYSIKET